MPDRYGASEDRWAHWMSVLGGPEDLLPAVANPHAVIAPNSTMKGIGKTPSRYNGNRQVVGIGKWTQVQATAAEVKRWAAEPDYSICIQTRRLRAIDIDVEDEAKATAILNLLDPSAQRAIRRREGTGKALIPFWYEGELPKHMIPVGGGVVEILADGQQFIAEGTHTSGERYQWLDGDIPTLDELDFAMLLAELREIATGEIKIARAKREPRDREARDIEDETADWLAGNWEVHDYGSDGQLFIRCPFEGEHTSDSGPSSTAYFPAGTGGHAEGHFVCLHAHCMGRSDAEFLHATGATAGAFGALAEPDTAAEQRRSLDGRQDDRGGAKAVENLGSTDRNDIAERLPEGVRGGGLPLLGPTQEGGALGGGLDQHPGRRSGLVSPDDPWPRLTRDQQSRIEPTMRNMLLSIAHPGMVGRYIAYDVFLDELMWAPADELYATAQWRAWRDSDYAWLRMALEERGFKPMGMELLRLAVLAVAERHQIDQAQTWLSRLSWDGVSRVRDFARLGWGWEDTPYAQAVSRYVWTAMAGRVVEPGIQADMVPVLVGAQGIRKTTAIKAMSPAPEFYTSIHLDAKDADTSRRMRGRLVVELEELRGLNTKAIEEIKAFITRTTEEWIPKFREFRTEFKRRLLFFATTNDEEIFNDPTGERRWLPGRCGGPLNIEWIEANRDQLWAEGAALFALDGVDWSEAETLAKLEHGKFKIEDPWTPFVVQWLADEGASVRGRPIDWEYITTNDALVGAVNIRPDGIGVGLQMRMGKVLRGLGFERQRRRVEGNDKPINVYLAPEG